MDVSRSKYNTIAGGGPSEYSEMQVAYEYYNKTMQSLANLSQSYCINLVCIYDIAG